MHTIRITDRPDNACRKTGFPEQRLEILSRSGLHATEALLITHLKDLATPTGALLIAGNRSGAIAMAATLRFPNAAITCHAFDVHHIRAIRRTLTRHHCTWRLRHDPFVLPLPEFASPPQKPGQPCITLACTASIPIETCHTALLMVSRNSMSGELLLNQLEEIHAALEDGGVCLMACESDRVALFKQVKALFGGFTIRYDQRGVCCLLARKRNTPTRSRDFTAFFPASLPGGPQRTLCSLPGVFCHRRPDAGGLALAEIAAREFLADARVLDMGCGCGVVGILLATAAPDARVTFVDAHARALAATHRNLTTLGMPGHTLVLSDTGVTDGDFTLVVGNPPYYADFRIADLFLTTARRTLRKNGVCLMVAKNAAALAARQTACFGNSEHLLRRGYGVIRSTLA